MNQPEKMEIRSVRPSDLCVLAGCHILALNFLLWEFGLGSISRARDGRRHISLSTFPYRSLTFHFSDARKARLFFNTFLLASGCDVLGIIDLSIHPSQLVKLVSVPPNL